MTRSSDRMQMDTLMSVHFSQFAKRQSTLALLLSDNGRYGACAAMTIQVELSPQAEARLAVEALAHGLAPEKYAGSLLQEALSSPARGSGKLSVEELHLMLRQIAEGSEKLPNLPTSAFTRESFYEDRL
jgi:hypothetical protein